MTNWVRKPYRTKSCVRLRMKISMRSSPLASLLKSMDTRTSRRLCSFCWSAVSIVGQTAWKFADPCKKNIHYCWRLDFIQFHFLLYSNICLMGDPGVAKSQLLKFIDRLAPRSKFLFFISQTSTWIYILIKSLKILYLFRPIHYRTWFFRSWFDCCRAQRSRHWWNDFGRRCSSFGRPGCLLHRRVWQNARLGSYSHPWSYGTANNFHRQGKLLFRLQNFYLQLCIIKYFLNLK